MSQAAPTIIASHQTIVRFPHGSEPYTVPNEWLIWSGSQDEGGLPDLEHGAHKVLVPFSWWIIHHHEADVIALAQKGQIGVWFATDDDILKHAELIEAGKRIWPLVAAHFPIFRDGRSFSTAALLRGRFAWQGEIRAIGDVLIDQLLQGARVGFDSFALRPDQSIEVALKQFHLFTVTTQNSWRDKRATLSV
jgi:uncharacterized protein (DUF934 family)